MRTHTNSAPLALVGGISQTVARTWLTWAGQFLLWSFAFGISYTQSPLYTSNQNTKFIHGLANAGLGFLTEDWLAKTTDVIPVFSYLVYLTYKYLHESMFYLYNILIFGGYLYSISGIVSTVYDINTDRLRHLTFLAVVTAIHSYALDSLSLRFLGFELGQFLHYGVAEQHAIGRIFQPSVFGVLIVLSIYAFLRRKTVAAVFLLAFSATIHPAYFLTAAVYTCAYMWVVFREQNSIKKSLAVGLLGLILTLPYLAYFYVQFRPTSPEIWNRAQDILVNVRSPHHMNADVWLNASAYGKVLLVTTALYLVRQTRLLPFMLLPFLVFLLSIVAQLLTSNNTLAASTPWRISVFLVPLSTGIIVAHLVAYAFEKFREPISKNYKTITGLSLVALLMLVLYGVMTQVKRHVKHYRGDSIPMMNFVRETKSSGETYLIPVELEDFRLYTGAPTFITFKSGAFKDAEYLEWYKRVVAASEFYLAKDAEACKMLKTFEDDYKITHVVVPGNLPDGSCEYAHALYKDDYYRVYRIDTKRSVARY
jgi:hypothetical protein